ncbi:hypothetical protein ACEQ8H_006980 [Pleosporales sp. CAS-2024a]
MSLQSLGTRNLLDVVDSLRSHGISRYIDLPEIIVCGEQSSGKSSVLEAVSGVKFPSKDNLCTRFATELILRRGPVAPVKISIGPSPLETHRSEDDLARLRTFHVSVSSENLYLDEIIESAKAAMGINDTDKVFSSDILRLELSGPEQPHLTLVDLLGLFQASSRSQSEADSHTVTSLVRWYMKRTRSIILAVVSAKSDFNNQSITALSRKIDPKGERTLGLITKPDTLDEGSDTERFYLEMAQNKDVKFRLGWHVLRNRDYAARDTSADERDEVEASFFRNGVWRSLPPHHVGIHAFKPRLSKILQEHIVSQLPDVLAQIKTGIQDCEDRLTALGASRANTQEQRRYLLRISQSFSTLVRLATGGQYSDPFFGDASTEEGYRKRLRAVLQNTLTDFAAAMRKRGHTYNIVDDGPAVIVDDVPVVLSQQISRTDYVAKVSELLQRSRGRELPGTFDPLIIGPLFYEQRKPWPALVDQYLESILGAVRWLVDRALARVCDDVTRSHLSGQFINVRLERFNTRLRSKVAELLKPYDTGHPITYNHYLTENVQKAQNKRRGIEIKKSIERLLGRDYTGDGIVSVHLNVNTLINTIVSKTEADMNNYASSTATDFMEAYYKVAMKNIIDDFSVLAIEACLIQKLDTLFTAEDVVDLDDAKLAFLAAEDGEASAEREASAEKLRILQEGFGALQSMRAMSPFSQGDSGVLANGALLNFEQARVEAGHESNTPTPPPQLPVSDEVKVASEAEPVDQEYIESLSEVPSVEEPIFEQPQPPTIRKKKRAKGRLSPWE